MNPASKPLTFTKTAGLTIGAVAAFTVAYSTTWGGCLMLLFFWCLIALTRHGSARVAFYSGLTIGMLAYSIQLYFFYSIFGPAAIILWSILAFWLAIFLLLAQLSFARLKPTHAALLVPFLWTGIEYFRSELYYLKFSWLNAGYVMPGFCYIGMYGAGFLAMLLVTAFCFRREIFAWLTLLRLFLILFFIFVAALLFTPALAESRIPRRGSVAVAGIQFEFEHYKTVLQGLDDLVVKYPDAKLLVLCEYTLHEPPPDEMKAWCRDHNRFLVVGGEQPTTNGDYYDTAFVIGTNGEVVFQQGKSVPIQFFKDGLPAREQKVWDSPWGKIGFCICYDLSYTRVTDELIRQGAQAIIVPTMDLESWGEHQHKLHALVAPVRASEYGVPIFRVASSGISQLVDANGRVQASAPFPGEGATLHGTMALLRPGRLPLDRILAPFCVVIVCVVIFWLAAMRFYPRVQPHSTAP